MDRFKGKNSEKKTRERTIFFREKIMLQCSVILPFKPMIPIYFEVSKNGHPQVIQVTPFSYGKPWWRLGIGEKIGFWVVPTGAGAARQVGANQAERLASRSPSPWQPWDAWNHGPHGKNGKTSCLIKAHKSIPSGKHTKSYGKSPFVLKNSYGKSPVFMGKSPFFYG